MNEAFVLAQQNASSGVGELILNLIGLPSKRATQKKLSAASEDLLKVYSTVIEDILLAAIEKRTRVEFEKARGEAFSKYRRAVMAFSDLVRIAIPERILQGVKTESYSEVEAELKDQAAARFGSTAKDQAVFTIWTIRKISTMVEQIVTAGDVKDDLKEEDRKISAEFSFYATWTQFHLDCLLVAIRFDKQIQPDVLSEICEGLRAAVNAYGLIRQGIGLRIPREETSVPPYAWDEEDQELLDSSMRDMESEEVL